MTTLATKFTGWFVPDVADPIDRKELHAGATFARMTKTQVTETARIIGISGDEDGIPHVRFSSRLHRADWTLDHGQRTLALPSFLNRFERLPRQSTSGSTGIEPLSPGLR